MKKVSIIYWSNGGNVEVMANAIAEGAASQDNTYVDIKHVVDASIDDILEADAIALGSPAMIGDEIEEQDMKPFVENIKEIKIKNKPLILFGSSGWRDENFIDKWQSSMEDNGFNVIGKLVVKDSLRDEELHKAKKLGETLIKFVK